MSRRLRSPVYTSASHTLPPIVPALPPLPPLTPMPDVPLAPTGLLIPPTPPVPVAPVPAAGWMNIPAAVGCLPGAGSAPHAVTNAVIQAAVHPEETLLRTIHEAPPDPHTALRCHAEPSQVEVCHSARS